jgi:hypothetical protein
MGIFRGTENEVLAGENINEAGITFNQIYGKIEHPVERLVKSIGRGNLGYGVVEDLNRRIISMNRRSHDITLSTELGDVQSQFFMDRINVF